MVTIKLNQLAGGTEFSFEGKRYIIGSGVWNSKMQKTYLGEQKDNIMLTLCHPFLGGQSQHKIDVWFNYETQVLVKHG